MNARLTIHRKTFTLFLLSIATCCTAVAQSADNKQPRQLTTSGYQAAASKEAAYLKHKLTLTDEQEGKLQQVLATFYESVLQVNSTDSLGRGKELSSLENKRDAAMRRLLSSEQFTQYTAGNTNARQQSASKREAATDKLKAGKKN